ncbi:hypothetical protein ACFFRR_010338 [Megaselia abdita]
MFKYAVLGVALLMTISDVSSLASSRFERQANNTNYYRPLGGVRWVEPHHQNQQKHNSTLNRWGNQYQPPTGNSYNATRPGNVRPGWNQNVTTNNTHNYQRPTNTAGGFVDNNYQRPAETNYHPQPATTTPYPVRPIATPATLPTQPAFGSGYNGNSNYNRGPNNANVQLSYDVPGRNNNAKQPQQPQNIPSSNPWGRF